MQCKIPIGNSANMDPTLTPIDLNHAFRLCFRMHVDGQKNKQYNEIDAMLDKIPKEAVEIHKACALGDSNTLKWSILKLESQGEIQIKTALLSHDRKNKTSLHKACQTTSYETVECILQQLRKYKLMESALTARDEPTETYKINTVSEQTPTVGNTALHVACEYSGANSIRALLKELEQLPSHVLQQIIETDDTAGPTVFQCALQNESSTEVLQTLLSTLSSKELKDILW